MATLQEKDVINAIKDVSNWRELGVQLGIKSSKLNEFEQYPVYDRKLKVVEWWMENDTDCGWKKLIEALMCMGHRRIAWTIRNKCLKKETSSCDSELDDEVFNNTQLMTVELLNEFKEHYHPPLFTSKDLAILFEKLLIFGKLEEGAWFVPSILPSLEEEEVEQYCEKKERALVIYFPDGGPKNGIFCSSVSFLLSNDNTSPAPWKVLKVSGNPVCLKHNVIIFTVGDFYGKVTLVEKWTHFELYVNTDEDNEEDLWKLVYNAVFNGLTKAAETHHYSDTDNIPQAAIICCEQDKDHPSTPHPATIKRQKGKWMWTCTKSQQWGGKVSGNIPWLNLGVSGTHPHPVQQSSPQLHLVGASQQHTSQQVREPSGRQQQGRHSQEEADMFHSDTVRSPPSKRLKITTGVEGVDGTTVLDEDDLHDVISTVADLAGSWRPLGIALKLRQGDLDSIHSASALSPGDCLGKMLTLWLRQNYNVERFGKPTWRRLVEAVEDRVGGNNHALALKIAAEHPEEFTQ